MRVTSFQAYFDFQVKVLEKNRKIKLKFSHNYPLIVLNGIITKQFRKILQRSPPKCDDDSIMKRHDHTIPFSNNF